MRKAHTGFVKVGMKWLFLGVSMETTVLSKPLYKKKRVFFVVVPKCSWENPHKHYYNL